MIDEMLSCTDLNSLTDFAVKLTSHEQFAQFQKDLKKERIVFMFENYWALDTVLAKTATPAAVQEALLSIKEAPRTIRILYTMQLLCQCCPAITASLDRLMGRMTI